MTMTKIPLSLVAFDAARYLTDDEEIAVYMAVVLEANDPDRMYSPPPPTSGTCTVGHAADLKLDLKCIL